MSLSKNKIKYIQSLKDKKSREEHRTFVVEGDKMVSELIGFVKCQLLIATSDFIQTNQIHDNNIEEILIQGINDNNQTPGLRTSSVQMYVFKNNIAFSNNGGNVINPYIISMFNYDGSNLLKYVSDITLDSSFNGSSSYFMDNDFIIMADTLSQDLYKYNFSGGKESIYKIKQNVLLCFKANCFII